MFASFFSSHYITSILVILIRSPCLSNLNTFDTIYKNLKIESTIPLPKDGISIIQITIRFRCPKVICCNTEIQREVKRKENAQHEF